MKASKWTTNPAAKTEPVKVTITKAGDDLIQVTLIRASDRGVSDRLRLVLNAREAHELTASLGVMTTAMGIPHV